MRNTNILDILAKKDEQAFQNFVESMEVGRLAEDEEAEFVLKAPPTWLEAYFKKVYPYPRSERCMMADPKYQKALKVCERFWGLYEENLLWAFQNLPVSLCEMVLNCLEGTPGAEVEKAMLERQDAELLKVWLKKFKVLSEEGERLLEENLSFQSLKSAYIEEQMR